MAGQLGPLNREPRRVRPPFDVADDSTRQQRGETADQWWTRIRRDRQDALLEALDGVELGEHDHRIVEWLASWDTSVVGAVASLFYRVHQVGEQSAGGAR